MQKKDAQSQVMKQWKKAYIDTLLTELRPHGDVLEVGFGYGFGPEKIQASRPKSHTIIESDPKIAEEAKKWASHQKNVLIIENTWQNALSDLGIYDVIFFNDYPLETDIEKVTTAKAEEAAATINEAKFLLKQLEKKLSELAVRYTDQDIDAFCVGMGHSHASDLPGFFARLRDNSHISEEQYTRAAQKYGFSSAEAPPLIKEKDPALAFLEECMKSHMRKGSRFSFFSPGGDSKYEDPVFFEKVIANLDLDYRERRVPIDVSGAPEDRHFTDALIIVIEKQT